MTTAPAQMSLHYHVARLRGAAGHPVWSPWARNATKVEAAESGAPLQTTILQQILPLDVAVKSLADARKKALRAHTDRIEKRLAGTQHEKLGRAHKMALERRGHLSDIALELASFDDETAAKLNIPTGMFTWKLRRALIQHRIGQAKVAEGMLASQRKAEHVPSWKETSKIYRKHLATLDQGDTPFKPPTVTQEAQIAGLTLEAAFEGSASWPGLNLEYSWGGAVDEDGTSTVKASGSARIRSLDPFAAVTDPCHWCTTIPDTFKQTYETKDVPLPHVTDTPKPATHVAGKPWRGYLYEVAALQLIPSNYVTEFRNILNVSFIEKKRKRITLEYSLYESLTSAAFGARAEGGIDVDSGIGTVTLSRDGKKVILDARKSIRFSPAAPYSEALNVIAMPWLIWWMSTVVIGGLVLAGKT